MEISGQTFLITGGGSGLGEATARHLAAAGANVVIADVNVDAAQRVADAIGKQARAVACDVTDSAAVAQAVAICREAFRGLNGAINCAGIGPPSRVLGKTGPHDLEHFRVVVTVNLIGTFNVIRLAAEQMAKGEPNAEGERGVIVNTASVAAFDGQIGQAAYSASKAGVVGMTLPIARELARFGIRVVTIAPGLFDTPMAAGLPDEARASLAQQIPFPPRFGRPEEYALLVDQIVRNPMLNGETIRLDGAIRMQPK